MSPKKNIHECDPGAAYWDALKKDAAQVSQLPHSIRGGGAARREEQEQKDLDATIAILRSKLGQK
jgi:hypothetical protein